MAARPSETWRTQQRGLYTRRPALGPTLPGEVILGRQPEPGNVERPDRGTQSFAGIYYSPGDFSAGQAAARGAATGAFHVLEAIDPAELWVQRTVVENLFYRAGFAEGWFRRHPPGWSTRLAKDHTAGDTTLWICDGRHFPNAVLTLPSGITFEVDGHPITYGLNTAVECPISGAYAIGATEMFIADGSLFPSGPFSAKLDSVRVSWEAQAVALAATTSGAHLAGATSLAITGDAAQLAAIPSAGVVKVITADSVTRYYTYSAKSVVSTSATLTLAAELDRSIPSGNAVTMDKITGITSEYGTWIVPQDVEGDWNGIAPGATEIQLDLGLDSTNPVPSYDIAALWASVPSSGTVMIESEVRNPPGGGQIDHPWRRIAYTAKASNGTLTLAAPLGFRISGGDVAAWARVESVPGLMKPRSANLIAHKLTTVAGFGTNASRGTIVSFNPRYRGWSPKDSALGFFVGGATSPSGPDAFAGLLSFKTLADVDSEGSARGQALMTLQDPKNDRIDSFAWEPGKAGVIGYRTDDERDRKYKFTVGGPFARSKAPYLDTVAGILYVRSLQRLPWPSPSYYPAARRIDLNPHNNISLQSEERIFNYNDLDLVANSFTGVTFKQSTQGPKTTTNGSQTLPTTPLTVVSTAPGGLGLDRFATRGKIRAKTGRAILARLTYTGKTDTTFTGVALGAVIDFLTQVDRLSLTNHLRLGDPSGAVATARVGSNGVYNGTPGLGVTGLLSGDSAKAVHLNSGHTGDWVELQSGLIGVRGTLALAFKWNSGTSLIADNTSAGSGWHIGYDHAGTFAVRIAGTQLDTSLATAAVANGALHTIAVAKDQGEVWVFVDGAQVAHGTGFANTAAVSRWLIGRDGADSNYSDMTAQEFIVSDTAWTLGEAAAVNSIVAGGSLTGAGTLASGTVIEEDYALSDFHVTDDRIGLADDAPYPAIASISGMGSKVGRPGQILVDTVGPNGEPGLQLGLTNPMTLYLGTDGNLHLLQAGVDKIVTAA